MRYSIGFDRLVNQLVPHYIGGRRLILYLQALVSPLQVLNDAFVEWAKETRIEASMTSQIFKFEWFLNRKFSRYFVDPNDRIIISHETTTGVPLYLQSDNVNDTSLYNQNGDSQGSINDNPAFYFSNETIVPVAYSFVVHAPSTDESLISHSEYDRQLRYWIERYRLASKTYNIIYQGQ